MREAKKAVLSVGAMQPLGQSGILVDWQVIKHLRAKPITVVTGVVLNDEDVEAVDATLLRRQLNSYIDNNKIVSAKTGLLVTRENVETIATFFEDNQHHVNHLMVDVSLESEEEMVLLSNTAISLLKIRLLPLAEVIIVFLSEAERLSGQPVKTISEMKEAAEAIKIYGSKNILVRADHKVEDEWIDIFYDGKEHQLLFSKEEPLVDPRKTRDVLSSALAVSIVDASSVAEAVTSAKEKERNFIRKEKNEE